MRRRIETLLPALVLLGFGLAAALVSLLLSNAQEQGVDALEELVVEQVEAVARAQDQSVSSSFTSAGPLLEAVELELVVGSEADRQALETLLGEVTERLPSGFFLVNSQGTITEGFGLVDRTVIGTQLDWPGFEDLGVGSDAFQGGVLPVSEALTTEEPATASVYPVESPSGELGALVLETIVGPESAITRDFEALRRGETGEFLYLDSRGVVVGASDPAMVAEPVDDPELLELRPGLSRRGGWIVHVAEVPAARSRVVFRQDVDEFESSLSRPLESVGQISVLLLLGAGFMLTIFMARRLRAAREEQERLRRLADSQQELISIVSHELRTPVAGVLGFLETTLDHWDGMDDADRHQAVGRAAVNARRLQAMTRDVLDAQAVESGRLVHVMAPVDLVDEVRSAVAAAKELDVDRTFDLRLPDREVVVEADADRIQQVMANLLDNARKSSPAVEPITVTLETRSGEAEVAVSDRGSGIDPESIERIFEKFVRGREDAVTGTGLGLYISRQIIDAHGGSIWAEADDGVGATFRFSLPLADQRV